MNPLQPFSQAEIEAIVNYKEPTWGETIPKNHRWYFAVVKEQMLIEEVDLRGKSKYVFGKLQQVCDHVMYHASTSRIHCIFQYGKQKVCKCNFYKFW